MAFSFKGTKVPEEELSGYMRARRRAFSGPLMFVVVVVAAIFVMSVFFRVEDIRVVGNQHYTAEEIIRAVDIEESLRSEPVLRQKVSSLPLPFSITPRPVRRSTKRSASLPGNFSVSLPS